MRTFTDEFKREAVRLAQTSGRTISQVADDLGIGKSTLGKWLTRHREADLLGGRHEDTAKENVILRQKRDFLKRSRVWPACARFQRRDNLFRVDRQLAR
jgi:transposase